MDATPDHPRTAIPELGGGAALDVFEVPARDVQQLGTTWSLTFRDPDGLELEVRAPGAPSTVPE